MKQKIPVSETVCLTILPALLLLFAAYSAPLAALVQVPAYLTLYGSGLCAAAACALWGAELSGRLLRPAARHDMRILAVLLTGSCMLSLVSTLPVFYVMDTPLFSHAGARLTQSAALALLAPAPAVLCRLTRTAQEAEPERDVLFLSLFVPGLLFSLLALTDVWHRLVLRDDGYGVGAKLVLVWIAASAAAVQVRLLLQCRGSSQKAAFGVLCALGLAAGLCMLLGIGGLTIAALPALTALFLFGTVALALAAELLPDGRSFPALLRYSTFPVQVMDREGTIRYGAELALPLTPAHRSAILSNRCPMILEKDMSLSVSPLHGGFALQQRDLRDLHALQDALEAVEKELADTRALLARENELEGKLRRLRRKNAFFARQEAKMQERTDRASMLLRCAAAPSPEPGFRRAVVTRANVLVSYVQQLGLLLHEAKETDKLPVSELLSALEASAQAATAAGLRCRVYNVAQGTFAAEAVLALYDLYELVLEEAISAGASALEVRLRNEQSGLRLVLTMQNADCHLLDQQMQRIHALAAEGGARAAMSEEDGCVTVEFEFGTGGDAV